MEENNVPWNQITWVHNNTSSYYSLLGDKEHQLKWAKLSLERIKKMYEKDPKVKVINYLMGLQLVHANKPFEAIKVFEQIDLKTFPFTKSTDNWLHNVHAYALIRTNKLVEAKEVLKYVPQEYATLGIYSRKSHVYILLQEQDSIQHMIKTMEENNVPWNQITWVHNNTSSYYSLLGDKEHQLKWAKLSLERIKKQSKFTEVNPGIEAQAKYYAGQYKEALPLYQDLAKAGANWFWLSHLGMTHAKMDNREGAEDVIRLLKTNDGPVQKGRYKYALARIYSALNEKELATEYLKRAFNEGVNFYITRYDFDPAFVPLHDYAPYEEFVKPKG